MIVLGIDTSCDDTSIGILKVKRRSFEILVNIVSSQVKLHAKYGGVFPFLAKREHRKNLPIVFKKALKEAKNPKIDLLAVTRGPGLEPCLWEGINFSKKLAKKLKIPLISINHIEAHVLINFLKSPISKIRFPIVCLVVSGGHTILFLMKEFLKYKILGETRDDAAGECFDKVARLLGLGYPGGPKIERIAKIKIKNKKLKIKLPRPMIHQKNYDFSFAGLKTAVLYDFKKRPEKERKSKVYKVLMAKEIQKAIIEVLVEKTFRALKEFKAKMVLLGGGVVANQKLRKEFKKRAKKSKIKLLIPEKKFCTDNGVMIALSGYFYREKATKKYDKIEADANLKI
jgi:N6-L-threonylcarbamoyladenine synthase